MWGGAGGGVCIFTSPRGCRGQRELRGCDLQTQLNLGCGERQKRVRFLCNVKVSYLTTGRAIHRESAPRHQKYVTNWSPTRLPGTEPLTTLWNPLSQAPAASNRLLLPAPIPGAHQPLHSDAGPASAPKHQIRLCETRGGLCENEEYHGGGSQSEREVADEGRAVNRAGGQAQAPRSLAECRAHSSAPSTGPG